MGEAGESSRSGVVRGAVGVGAVGALAVAGKVLVKVLAVAGGVAIGRAAGSYLHSSPEGRETLAGIRSVATNADDLLRPYHDSSSTFYERQGALAAAVALTPEEQDEVLGFRRELANALDTEACARGIYDGAADARPAVMAAMQAMPKPRRLRMAYIAGRGVGRVLQGERTPGASLTDDEVPVLFQRYASPAELEAIATGSQSGAPAAARCRAARLMLDIVQRPAVGSAEHARAVRWVLSLGQS